MNIEIANRLLELRKKHGLSQEQLAEKLGISRQSVSKWERAEASPDTDNLLMLANLYGVSLDELIRGFESAKQDQQSTQDQSTQDQQNTFYENTDEKGEKVRVGLDGIFVENKKEKVEIGWHGIHVEERGREKFHLSQDEGMRVDGEEKDIKDYCRHHREEKRNPWCRFPYAIVAFAVMFLWGYLGDAWSISWIVLLTIPLYHTFVSAVIRKKPGHFAYPVLTVIAFFLIYYYGNLPFPAWIVFLTIPIYYWWASAFKGRE